MLDFSINKNTLFIMPHLDDEFALSPLINFLINKNKDNCFFLYCAEQSSNLNKCKRKLEAFKVMKYLNVKVENIMFLNNYFKAETRKLYKVYNQTQKIIDQIIIVNRIKQIFTLGFEGGHPDHDIVALIVSNLNIIKNVHKYYVPAYNRYDFGFFPIIQVCTPLPSQRHLYKKIFLERYCWKSTFKIAYFYKSQLKTFLILLPFIFFIFFFRKYIYISNEIEISSVNWNKSLSKKRYQTDFDVIKKIINKTTN